MALLFMEGFATNDVAQKWDAGSSIYTNGNSSPAPRVTGGYWAWIYNSIFAKTIPASSKVIIGSGVQCNTAGQPSYYWTFYGDAGATAHITVHRNSSGFLEIRRGTTAGTLLATGTTSIPINVWAYVEVSATISDTVGEVHVRLNGISTDEVSYTGDTKNGGTASTIDKVQFGTASGSNNIYFTDIYICDDTGSAPNNTFLGDVTVRTLAPNGNGNSSQLLGSDGNSTDNYLLVDEKPFSSVDYAGSGTTGQKDTYALDNLPASATSVYGVQVNANILKSDASASQSRIVIRSGGTDYGGTTRALSTSAITYTETYNQNPNTSASWTAANVNGLEAGMEVM
jgi:hypothetical protein